MDLFDVLTLICGLALFLYGMDVMGDALKKSAKNVLGRGVAVKLVEDDGSEEVAEDKLDALSKFDIISFE